MTLIGAWMIALPLVMLVSAAIFGYGLIAATYSRHSKTSLVLGLGFYAGTILLTGVWGGYTGQVQTLLLAFGLAALWTYRRQTRRLLPLELPRGRDRWWLVLPAVYFLTRLFTCGLPQQHSDPLYYHLSAPQLWVELGQIRLTADHPSFSQAALWETFYGLPQIWFGTKGAPTHVIVQLFGQWMHCLWGQGGCLLLAAALLTTLASPLEKRPGLAVFIAWLCTTQPVFEWLGCLAKNDYIICLFVLAAVIEVLDRRWLLTGFLMGFAYSTKVLAAWAALSILVFIPWRKWAIYFAGAAFAALPFLFRNYWWTHNPLFPNLDQVVGPHWISSWWVNHNLSFGGGPKFDPAMFGWLSGQMFQKIMPKIILAAGFLALTIELVKRRKAARLGRRRWVIFLGIQTVLIFLMLRPGADGRYGNFTAMGALIFAAACIVREAARWKPLWRYGAPGLLALGLLINSPLDELIKIPRNYWFQPAVHYVEQFHPVYDMQAWVQANVASDDKIVFTAEKQQFYLDRPFETVVEMKKWEDVLTPIHSATQLFSVLRSLGYRYVHFSPQAGGYPIAIRPYWPEIVALSNRAAFKSPTSLIFDLRRADLKPL